MLSNKMDFNYCAIWDDFSNLVTYSVYLKVDCNGKSHVLFALVT